MNAAAQDWALALFRRSVLKREKFRRIVAQLDDLEGKTCLDVGGDNGVISLLLRRRGGTWHSADLGEPAVQAIRELVGTRVHRLDGATTPFADDSFDRIVVVDYLEHIEADVAFVAEVRRILRPGGWLILNVPHLKPHSLLNRVRRAVGLTDERHGHVRPGYSHADLHALLDDGFEILAVETYSRAFSEAIDTVLNLIWEHSAPQAPRSAKGPLVTRTDTDRLRRKFRLLGLAFPALWLVSRLDGLLFLQPGYKLVLKARRLA